MTSAAKVGIFMLVVLAILGFFILKIEDLQLRRSGGTRKINVVFDSVAGLDEKSAVRVAGVRKGKVSEIKLTPDGKALVTLEVDGDVSLRRGASARVSNLGLLGEKYVELEPGPANAPLLAADTQQEVTLPGSQPASIDDVTNQVSAIAEDVKAITASLRSTMAGPQGQQRIEDIVDNVHEITAQVRLLIEANRGNVTATASNLRAITDDLRVEIPKIAASIDRVANQLGGTVGDNREDVRVIVENLKTLSADLKTTADNLNTITGRVRAGEGTIGKLFAEDEAHDRLVGALESVESGVGELKNTLGRVGRIQLDLGINAEYQAGLEQPEDEDLRFPGSSRTGIQARIVPNPELNRFYNIELNDVPRGDRKDKIVETVVTDPVTGEKNTTITRETKYERDFLISAQAGWQFDEIALRVGLFDSSGGVGADYDINDRLRVTGEIYDFGEKLDDDPHIRMIGQYTIRQEKPQSPLLFISTGVDNVLNDNAFIFGGGIRWRDEDLKYLLGSIPTP
jgi:phospholipid/cholesterol/gamma-HCH transport system substrate-binding protein